MTIQALSPVRLTPVRFGNASGTDDEKSTSPALDQHQVVGGRGAETRTGFEELRKQIKPEPGKHGDATSSPSPTSRQGRFILAGNHIIGFLKSVGIALGGGLMAFAGNFVASRSGKTSRYIALPLLLGGAITSTTGLVLTKYHQIAGIYQAIRGIFAKSAEKPAP